MDQGDARRWVGIQQLVARSVDAWNRRDVDAFVVLWEPGARWEVTGREPAVGRDAIAAACREMLAGVELVVQLQPNGVVDLHAWPVHGRWYLTETMRLAGGAGASLVGVYHDTYEEGAEGWWFTSRRLEVLHRQEVPASGTGPRP